MCDNYRVSEGRREEAGIIVVLADDCKNVTIVGRFDVGRISENKRCAYSAAPELSKIRMKRVGCYFFLRPVKCCCGQCKKKKCRNKCLFHRVPLCQLFLFNSQIGRASCECRS